MATAPTVPDFSKWDFKLNDTDEILVKDNARNAALKQFGNSLTAMTDSINVDLETMESQKSATQQAATAASTDAQQVALDKQAVASDRQHVDQQKQAIDATAGQVSSHAQQVAEDKQAVATDTATATQAASDASTAADDSIQAKNDAQALYGDLAAVDTAKTEAQQAATTAGEERGLAVTAREGAEAAQGAAETAASTSEQAATNAVAAHEEKLDPHSQYAKNEALKAGAYRETVGGDGPVFALRNGGLSPTFADDVNSIKATGTYYGLAPDNRPDGWNGHYFWSQFSSDFQKFLFLAQNNQNRAWIGGCHNGVFSPPAEIFTKQNILGPVSKSGGVPTGGIIERGSNSDGEYVKFADETLICRAKLLIVFEATSAQYVVWNFPYPFADAPSESHIAENSRYFPYSGNISNRSIRVGLRIYNDAAISTTQTVRPTAIGTWSA